MMDSSATTGAVLNGELEQAAPAMSLQRYMTLVGWGLFVTTVGQMASIGELPLRFLLIDELHVKPTAMALFIQMAQLPWSFKPIAGLLSDAFPLLGSRRRIYLMLSAGLAGLLWLAMGVVPRTYWILLGTAVTFNIMAALASTVTGGLLVQGAQEHNATGRFSALRLVIINLSYVAGPIGGFLAARAFGWTALTGGLLFLSLIPMAIFLLREPPTVTSLGSSTTALQQSWKQLKTIFQCKTLWAVGGLFFLIQVAPGLYTPLRYYQKNTLKFDSQFMGNLGLVYGTTGLMASFVYPLVCRRFRLRPLLYVAITCTVMSNLAYLGYVSRTTAIIIEGAAGLGLTLAQLPLFDLAARATPKGSEALGYSLMIACWNWGLFFSDILGSWLFEQFGQTFRNLVWVNAGTTALVLIAVPFLPSLLVDKKEGESANAPSPSSDLA